MYKPDDLNVREESKHPQGSEEWYLQRLGMITASKFAVLMVNGKGEDGFGDGAFTYMRELIGQILTGTYDRELKTFDIQWGNDTEPLAALHYEEKHKVKLTECGFFKVGERQMCGGSPDRLIGNDGCLEIKCPSTSKKHVDNLFEKEIPKEHIWQCQGHMLITGRQYTDYVSYDPRVKNPELRMMRVTLERNESQMDELWSKITKFENLIHRKIQELSGF